MSDRERGGRLPDFMIGGEAKCGSTTLWQILSQHPRVFFPEQKELHYFSSYSAFSELGRLETHGLDPYRQLFAAARADQKCGEATPNYLFDPGACRRIANALPGVRLLFILRDPVERAWSQYWHQVRRGRERLPFEAALQAEARRLEDGDADQRTHFSYAARGHYVEGLRRYERALSRDQICVVFLEELRQRRTEVVAQVCAHLGLTQQPLEHTELPHANQATFPRWPRLAGVGTTLGRWGMARGPSVSRWTRALGRVTRPFRVYSGQPRMREETRRSLRESFEASDHELAEWLGRPPPWSESPRAEGTSR